MLPKHIEFINTLLENAQTQVKAAILAETNIMIEGIVNRQNIILEIFALDRKKINSHILNHS